MGGIESARRARGKFGGDWNAVTPDHSRAGANRSSGRAALLGLVLTMQVALAATYYSDPAAGSSAGDGSANAPWPKLQTVFTEGKLGTLQGGDTLLLRSGNHGDVRLSGDNATAVTIAAAPGQRPQLGRQVVTRGANWRVKGLTISPSFAPAPYEGNIVNCKIPEPGVRKHVHGFHVPIGIPGLANQPAPAHAPRPR